MRFIQKLGNKGLSMVELICAIAIVSILGALVSSIMLVSANTYKKGSAETTVQQEAQLVCNQIADLIIDSTAAVKFEATSKKLTIQQEDTTVYVVYLSGSDLFFVEGIPSESETEGIVYSDPQLMAENVSEFSVNDTQFKQTGNIILNLTTLNGDHNYAATFTITSRNRALDVGDILTSKVKLTQTQRKWLVEPGQKDVDLSSLVTVNGVTTISWGVSGSGKSSGTTINAGKLTVDKNETCSKLKVSASTGGVNASTVYIDVYVRRVNKIEASGTLLTSDNPYGINAEYDSNVSYIGTSLNQAVGAVYDLSTYNDSSRWKGFVDPKTATYSISEGGEYATVSSTGRVHFNQALPSGKKVKVVVTSAHAAGANRCKEAYATVEGDYIIENKDGVPPFIPFTVPETKDGWRRLSHAEQASANEQALKQLGAWLKENKPDLMAQWFAENPSVNGTEENWLMHYFEGNYSVSYKRTIDGVDAWQTFASDHPLMVAHDGGKSLNMRPLMNSSMDLRYDYNVRFNLEVKLNDGTPIYEWSFGDTVAKAQLPVISNYYLNDKAQTKWEEGAVNINNITSVKDDSKFLALVATRVSGLEPTASAMNNILEGKIQKLQNGVYSDYKVDGKTAWMENKGLNLQFGDLGNNNKLTDGSYRILLYINTDKSTAKMFTSADVVEKRDRMELMPVYNSSTGDGVFYFTIDSTKDTTHAEIDKRPPVLKADFGDNQDVRSKANGTYITTTKISISNEGGPCTAESKGSVEIPYSGNINRVEISGADASCAVNKADNKIVITFSDFEAGWKDTRSLKVYSSEKAYVRVNCNYDEEPEIFVAQDVDERRVDQKGKYIISRNTISNLGGEVEGKSPCTVEIDYTGSFNYYNDFTVSGFSEDKIRVENNKIILTIDEFPANGEQEVVFTIYGQNNTYVKINPPELEAPKFDIPLISEDVRSKQNGKHITSTVTLVNSGGPVESGSSEVRIPYVGEIDRITPNSVGGVSIGFDATKHEIIFTITAFDEKHTENIQFEVYGKNDTYVRINPLEVEPANIDVTIGTQVPYQYTPVTIKNLGGFLEEEYTIELKYEGQSYYIGYDWTDKIKDFQVDYSANKIRIVLSDDPGREGFTLNIRCSNKITK